MEVSVCVLGHVVVEDDVDTLDIHAAAEQVGGDKDSLKNIYFSLSTSIKLIRIKCGWTFVPLASLAH